MRILMHERADGAVHPGGDLVQLRRWTYWLRRAGHQVVRSADAHHDLTGFDLVHLNNLGRAAALLPLAERCGRHGIPTVLTTLYWPTTDFERHGRPGWLGRCVGWLPDAVRDRLKSGVRFWRRPRSEHWRELWHGTQRVTRNLLNEVSAAIAVCEAEAELLRPMTGVPIHIVPSGVDLYFSDAASPWVWDEQERPEEHPPSLDVVEPQDRVGVLCVGRFDPQKGQHRLIAALADVEVPITLVGGTNPNYPGYRALCARRAGPLVTLLPPQPLTQLRRLYASCQVHAQASWYELSSLSALEAAASGAGIVTAAAGGMPEYLGGEARYGEPGDVEGLRAAVLHALAAPPSARLAERMRRCFTWELSTRQLADAYAAVLAHPASSRRAA
ncbi:MAG TPA: glycosyltransferase family 4 protein [Gemmatales bacterium]|nr:glycosyltransferase family 4 protein [Gemmatales bacterium]